MTTPTLPDRLRALFASRVHHFTPHGHDGKPQPPAFAIVATEERLADLLTAADRLELIDAAETLEQVKREVEEL